MSGRHAGWTLHLGPQERNGIHGGSNPGHQLIVNLDVLATGYFQGLPTVSSATCAEQRVSWRPRLNVDRR